MSNLNYNEDRKTLVLNKNFDQSLDDIEFPDGLQTLIFSGMEILINH